MEQGGRNHIINFINDNKIVKRLIRILNYRTVSPEIKLIPEKVHDNLKVKQFSYLEILHLTINTVVYPIYTNEKYKYCTNKYNTLNKHYLTIEEYIKITKLTKIDSIEKLNYKKYAAEFKESWKPIQMLIIIINSLY